MRACVCVVFKCWIVCAPGGLVCTRECERTSKRALFFFFTPLSSLFFSCLQLCVFVTTALQRQKVKCCIGAAVSQAGRQ